MNEAVQRQAELLVADAVGEVIEFWGFRKALGRLWSVVFLAEEALPADVLAERLHMSAGAVSMALGELQHWGVLRRVWKPGQRKEFFEAETDVWKMISKVVAERERFLLRSVRDRLEAAAQLLKQAPTTREVKKTRERVAQLLAFVGVAQSIVEAFIASRQADFSPLGDLLQFRRRRAERS